MCYPLQYVCRYIPKLHTRYMNVHTYVHTGIMHVDCCHWMLPGGLFLYSVDLLDSSSSPPADLGPSGGSSSLSDVFSLPPLPHGQVQSNLVASTPPQSSDLLADLGLSLGSLPPAGMHSCVWDGGGWTIEACMWQDAVH